MPDDPAGRCAVSVHYYTPSYASWGKCRTEWGTHEDIEELERDNTDTSYNRSEAKFIDSELPDGLMAVKKTNE